jgi:adenylate cyclase
MEQRVNIKHNYLAVLPLQNLSEDPDIEKFCAGLVMDLITDLSRFRSFQIIAYDTIKNLHPNEKIDAPVLHNLELDYLLKGMVRHLNDPLILQYMLLSDRFSHLIIGFRLTS